MLHAPAVCLLGSVWQKMGLILMKILHKMQNINPTKLTNTLLGLIYWTHGSMPCMHLINSDLGWI